MVLNSPVAFKIIDFSFLNILNIDIIVQNRTINVVDHNMKHYDMLFNSSILILLHLNYYLNKKILPPQIQFIY